MIEPKDQMAFKLLQKSYAENKFPTVFFAGSGLSAEADLPDWRKLYHFLVNSAKDKVKSLAEIDRLQLTGKLSTALNSDDYWVSFQLLKQILGSTSFNAVIRNKLEPDENCERPKIYDRIARMDVRAIVTTNLDGFAGQALSNANPGILINSIDGVDIARKFELLRRPTPYVVNIHGIITDSTTWILTKRQLDNLLESTGHRIFLENLFCYNTVIFLGITADDLSISGRLVELKAAEIRPAGIYWLTDRRDLKTDRWAEEHGVQVIRYSARPSHKVALDSIFRELETSQGRDEPINVPVIDPSLEKEFDEIKPDELSRKDPEFIRYYLSSKAQKRIVDNKDDPEFKAYYRFCDMYKYAVHCSLFIEVISPNNIWFGYELLEESGSGRFSKVYRAKNQDGEYVAVKILDPKIGSDSTMLVDRI